jgi:hypothetical protein
MTDSAGTLEKALERNLFNVRHKRPLPLLDLALGEVLGYPCHFNKTRIPRRRLPAGRQGSVPGGSAQCNNEIKGASLCLNILLLAREYPG